MKKIVKLSLVAVFLLSGCSVGPDFTPPLAEVPTVWDGETKADSVDMASWAKMYEDEKLKEYIKEALEKNKDIKIAATQYQLFLAQLGFFESLAYPQLNASASISKQEQSSLTANRSQASKTNFDTNTVSIGFSSFEIDFWGKISRSTEAAKASLLASKYNHQLVIQGVVSGVVLTYIELQESAELLSIAKKNSDILKEIENIAKNKFEKGAINKAEYLQASANTALAQTAIVGLENQIKQLQYYMSILVGNNPNSNVGFERFEQIKIPEVSEGVPSDILKRRPDILQSQENLHYATAQIGIAKASYFPSFSLTALFGYQSAELNDLLRNPAQMWQVTPSVSLPIFDANKRKYQVDAATATMQEAKVRYEKTVLTALQEVQNTLVQRKSLKEQSFILSQKLTDLQEAQKIIKKRYELGQDAYISLLAANQAVLQSKNEVIQNKAGMLKNSVLLYKVLGGEWEN